MSIPLKRGIYLDNAASTPMDRRVKKVMAETTEIYGNPSSFNDAGREARKKLEYFRLEIARFIGARPEEIIFTASGSEANNLAIFGLAGACPEQSRREIISTKIEHLSVLESLKELEKWGWKITYLEVDKDGVVSPDDLEKKLNPSVVLVSVMYANNEIGTIQPIKKIAKIISDFRNLKLVNSNLKSKNQLPVTSYQLLFHVDACQAAGYLDMNMNNLGVDLLTFNGTKIYGPKGIGVLCVRKGTSIAPHILGGGQERGYRAGTENLPAIAGLAKAVSLIDKKESARVSKLRDYFLVEIKKTIPTIRVNGPEGQDRLPNNINISIPDLDPVRSSRAAVQRTRASGTSATSNGVDSENLLLELDKYGIYASSGSACTSHSVEPSHVLKAIGVEEKYLNGALRFSLGRQTARGDIDYVLRILPKVVKDLRKRYNNHKN